MMNFENFSFYLSFIIVDHLIKNNINQFFIAPGSRSSLLTMAVAKHPKANKFICIDERSLGFLALGWSKKNNRPAVVITTSGTAVANLFPSILESSKSHIPLLILTTDRPFELLDSNANQTTEQANIFSGFVKKSYNIAPPSEDVPVDAVKGIFSKALKACMYNDMGPVHINLQFREPLANIKSKKSYPWPKDEDLQEIKAISFFEDLKEVFCFSNGLIVIGEMSPNYAQKNILDLAKKIGWPVYADILSNARFLESENIIDQFELCLSSEKILQQLDFSNIVFFGSRIVSKKFWQWLGKTSKTKLYHVTDSCENVDQNGKFSSIIADNLLGLTKELLEVILPKTHSNNLLLLKEYETKFLYYSEKFLQTQKNNNEASFCMELLKNISSPTNIFLSASMPIRYFDYFCAQKNEHIKLYSNRGLSGIDGVLSSAIGMSMASDKEKNVLIIGDIAFLHDANGLLSFRNLKKPLLVVVINNNGGAIFNLLPIAHEKEIVEEFFITPQHCDIEKLCRAYDVNYERISTIENFSDTLKKFFAEQTNTIVEIKTDGALNAMVLKKFFEELSNL